MPEEEDKLKKFLTTLEGKLVDLTTLEIRTVVGSFVSEGGLPEGKIRLDGAAHFLNTSIDLLEGDITSEIDEWFLAPEHKAVLDLHHEREKQGNAIIRANVQTIKELWQLASEMLHGRAGTGTGPGGTTGGTR
jgi:hypothetical protein